MTELLQQLMGKSDALRFAKNTVIIKEGETAPYSMYIILQGEARVVRNYGEVDQKLIATLAAGNSFGEMSLFLKQPRTATVITSAETVVLEITEDNAFEVMESNSRLFFGMIKGLCKRIDYLNEKVLPQYRV